MEWEYFVDCVDSVVYGVSIVLIDKHGILGIDSKGADEGGQS